MTAQWLRCPATDADGLRCVRVVAHQGKHEWQQCDWTDPQGYPCFLPPGHPGAHELAWFARPTTPGATQTVRHQGQEDTATAEAAEDTHEFAFHHWFPISQTYVPRSRARGARLLALLKAEALAGELVVVYEYRPEENAPSSSD